MGNKIELTDVLGYIGTLDNFSKADAKKISTILEAVAKKAKVDDIQDALYEKRDAYEEGDIVTIRDVLKLGLSLTIYADEDSNYFKEITSIWTCPKELLDQKIEVCRVYEHITGYYFIEGTLLYSPKCINLYWDYKHNFNGESPTMDEWYKHEYPKILKANKSKKGD